MCGELMCGTGGISIAPAAAGRALTSTLCARKHLARVSNLRGMHRLNDGRDVAKLTALLVTSSCKIKNRCFRSCWACIRIWKLVISKQHFREVQEWTIEAVEMETDGTVAELHRLADL